MAKAQRVFAAGITREAGWLYYLDSNCNIARSRMVRGGQRKKPGEQPEIVVKTDIQREEGYLYFIDKQGNVSRSRMSRGGAARRRKPAPRVGASKKGRRIGKRARAAYDPEEDWRRPPRKGGNKRSGAKKKAAKKKAAKKKAARKKAAR